MDTILQPLIQSPKFPDYVEVLKGILEEEVNRKEFYNWLDEDKRAEFIGGQVVIYSPARLLHKVVLKKIMRLIDSFVENNKVVTELTEQALVKLKRSDVLPDFAFWKGQTFTNNTNIFPVSDFVTRRYIRRGI